MSLYDSDLISPDTDPMILRLHWTLNGIANEVLKAQARFPAFNSAHEGKAVIEEELDELWDEIKANRGYSPEAMVEAKQTAAMCVRYIIELTGREQEVAAVEGRAAK